MRAFADVYVCMCAVPKKDSVRNFPKVSSLPTQKIPIFLIEMHLDTP